MVSDPEDGGPDSLPDELPLSDGESDDLPAELPLDGCVVEPSESGELGAAAPATPTANPRGLGPDPAELPDRPSSDFALVHAPTVPGRGRGRGRPKKVGPRLVDEAAVVPSLPLGDAHAVQSLADSAASSVPPAMTARSWLVGDLSIANARGRSKVATPVAQLRYSRVVGGFAIPSPDLASLAAGMVLQLQDEEPVGDEEGRLSTFVMESPSCAISSWESLSATLGMHRHTVARLFTRAAASASMLLRIRVKKFEEEIMASLPRASLIHCVESVQYDETPLFCRIVGDSSSLPDSSAPARLALTAEAHPMSSSSSMAIRTAGQPLSSGVKAAGAAQKVMQTRGHLGWVLKLGEKLVSVSFPQQFPLGVLEQCTAKVIKHHQLSISRLTRASQAFAGLTRAVCTYAFSGNIGAELSIANDRSAISSGCSSLHLLCGVHATAGCYTKTFALLNPHITGVIRAALALRTGAAMSRFRDCLRMEIASRLAVKDGLAPAGALQYKVAVCRLFVSHGRSVVTRRALLALCPNGEWRVSSVEYYHGPRGRQLNDEAILDTLTEGLVVALASSQPTLYNRSKWTGSDMAVDDLGIFEAVHRLLSTTFARFCASFHSGTLAKQFLTLGLELRHYGGRTKELEGNAEVLEGAGAELLDGARELVETFFKII